MNRVLDFLNFQKQKKRMKVPLSSNNCVSQHTVDTGAVRRKKIKMHGSGPVVEAPDLKEIWKEHLGSDWFPVQDVTLWIRKRDEEYSVKTSEIQSESCKISPEEFKTFFEDGDKEEMENGWNLYTSKGEWVTFFFSPPVCVRAAGVAKTVTIMQDGKECTFPRGHFVVELVFIDGSFLILCRKMGILPRQEENGFIWLFLENLLYVTA